MASNSRHDRKLITLHVGHQRTVRELCRRQVSGYFVRARHLRHGFWRYEGTDFEFRYAGLGQRTQQRDPLFNSEVLGLRLEPIAGRNLFDNHLLSHGYLLLRGGRKLRELHPAAPSVAPLDKRHHSRLMC